MVVRVLVALGMRGRSCRRPRRPACARRRGRCGRSGAGWRTAPGSSAARCRPTPCPSASPRSTRDRSSGRRRPCAGRARSRRTARRASAARWPGRSCPCALPAAPRSSCSHVAPPSVAAMQPGLRPAAHVGRDRAVALPRGGVQPIGIARVDHQIGGAGPLVVAQDVRSRSCRRPSCGTDRARRRWTTAAPARRPRPRSSLRVDDDLGDVLGVLQAQVRPGAPPSSLR